MRIAAVTLKNPFERQYIEWARTLRANASAPFGRCIGGPVRLRWAVARIGAAPLDQLVTTDTIQATEAVAGSPKIRQLSVAPLIAEAIRRITEERSVSSLFD